MTTVDRDHCLLLYPLPVWETIEEQIVKLPSLNRQARRLQRLMIGHATETDMDSHGRVRLPRELREFAELDGQVMFIGQGAKFEIWDEKRWIEKRDAWLLEESESLTMSAELEALNL